MRLFLILLCSKFLFSQSIFGDTSTLVKAISEFLLERANDNFIYIVEKKIDSNKVFKLYFKETHTILRYSGLKELISNKRIWEESIKDDLESITDNVILSFAKEFTGIDDALKKSVNNFWYLYQNGTILIDEKHYKLNVVPNDQSSKITKKINELSEAYLAIHKSIDSLKILFTSFKKENVKSINISRIIAGLDFMNDWNEFIEKNQSIIQCPGINFKTIFSDFEKEISNAKEIIKTVYKITKSKSVTYQVINAFKLIDYLLISGKDKPGSLLVIQNNLDEELKLFYRYVLFFSQLAEADNKETVKSILKSYLLPSVSYAIKRESSQEHFLISSYLGISVFAEYKSNLSESKIAYGLYTPIGLEYSIGLSNKNCLAFAVNLFDFSSPVNSIIYDQNKTIELKDLISPGISISYGFSDIPLAAGLAYSYEKNLRQNSNTRVNHIRLFLAFDMPLYRFY